MKGSVWCLGLILPLSVLADQLPSLKAGLWETETVTVGQSATTKIKQCVDASTVNRAAQMAQDMGAMMGGSCSKNEFRKEGDRYISEVDCTAAGGIRIISKTVLSGDFRTRYSGETSTRFEPGIMGLTHQEVKINARWVGPCGADMQPGDVFMPDGRKMNINALGQDK